MNLRLTPLTLILLILGLAACAVPVAEAITPTETPAHTVYDAVWETKTITVSSSANKVDLDPILAAWAGPITFKKVASGGQIRFFEGTVPRGKEGAEATTTMDDEGYLYDCSIRVHAKDTARLTHELGHCLGLEHSTSTKAKSNMYMGSKFYTQGWSDTVTDYDLSNLADLYKN